MKEEVPLLGLTLKSALNLLAKADRRYYWTESDGVIVMRPVVAWAKQDHFLHQTISGLELKDANIGGALDAVLAEFQDRTGSGAVIMSRDSSILNLSLGPLSVVQALDAIVREHGTLAWEISYCLPEFAADIAMLQLIRHDQAAGIGATVGRYPIGPDGKGVNRCRVKKH